MQAVHLKLERLRVVAMLASINVALAFAAQASIYRAFGASLDTDAYFAASAILQAASAIVVTTLGGALMPLLSGQPASQQAALTLRSLVFVVGALTVFCSALAWTASAWVPWLFPGFGDSVLPRGVLLVRIHLTAIPIAAASAVLAVLFQARQHFARVELISLCLNVLLVGALYFFVPSLGVEAAAWAYACRWALQALCLAPVLRGGRLAEWPGGLRALWRRAAPLLAGNAYFKSDVLVDRHLLSMADAGALSLFALAQSLWSIVAGVIGQSLGNTAVPVLAAAAQREDREAFRNLLRKRSRMIAWISAVAALLVIVLAPPALELVTSRPLVTGGNHALWMLLAALVGVPVFGAIGALVAGTFYALGDTRTPTLISAVTFTVMIACKIWVFREFGVLALCLATTIYYAVNLLVTAHALRLRVRTDLRH